MISVKKSPFDGASMTSARLLTLAENTSTMTFTEGLAFIDRTRRQLDRFDELPHAPGETIAPEDAAEIRQMCDRLEADIHRSLGV